MLIVVYDTGVGTQQNIDPQFHSSIDSVLVWVRTVVIIIM